MVEKNVAVRFAAVGGRAVKAEFTAIGREGARAFDQINRAGRSGSSGLLNVGYQVQDFAVQVAGGTSATRALSQQLPQLLSGFGLLGVVLGTATAIFAPLIGMLFTSADAAEGLDDRMSELEQATRGLIDAALLAVTPMEQLRAKFGDNAEAVNELYRAQLQLARFDFLKSQANVTEGVQGSLSAFAELIARINEIESESFDLSVQFGALAELQSRTGELNREFGLTVDQARNLADALADLGTASGPQEVFDAARALQTALMVAADESGRLPEPLEEAYRAAVQLAEQALPLLQQGLGEAVKEGERLNNTDMSAGIRSAAAETNLLIGRLIAANRVAGEAQAVFDREHKVYGGRGGDPRLFDGQGAQPFVPAVNSGGGGGGGGQSAAQKEQNDLLREAERLYEQTRTAAEKYAAEQAKLTAMLDQGLISQDTYNRALEGLKDRFGDLDKEAEKTKDAFKDFFGSIIDGSASAEEALSKLLASFADRLFSSGFDSLFDLIGGGDLFAGLFGSAKGNVFAGGNVVPFAKGGLVDHPALFPMRNGLGLMGEAGPEAIMPLARGPGGRLGVISNGEGGAISVNVNVTVDARGATEGTAEQVAKAVRAQIPEIVRAAVAGVASARKRGRDV